MIHEQRMIYVATGVACVAVALVLAFLSRDRALHRKVSALPTPLAFSVVDIGGLRYFDVRRFPEQALLGSLHVDAAKRSIAESGVAAYVWVLPPAFASILLECEGVAQLLLLAHLRDPVPQPTPVLVYIDGWRPDPSLNATARHAGVQLLVELPRLIGPDEDHNVRAMLDEASG